MLKPSLPTLAVGAFLLAASASAASALDPDGSTDPLIPPCLQNTVLNSFSSSTTSVPLGGSVTLAWNVSYPSGCSVQLRLAGRSVTRSGTMVLFPEANSTYSLTASVSSTVMGLAQARVNVVLPATVYVTRDDQQALFIQAVGTPNTTVVVTNNVNLNLSNRESIAVATGVTLRGGRTARIDGARLYTTTMPSALFSVNQADHVRITGLRIEGAELGIGTGALSRGIQVVASNDVLVDNNEISGWTAVGVAVNDSDSLNRIDPVANPDTVRVRDNFIHHCQYEGKFGYGVALGAGASALIERNVFDWNRHAIASNGRLDTSYRALENLVLEHGGYHRNWPVYGWTHTHQFDMHGTDNCGIGDLFSDALYNCGDAGHHVDLRRNSFLYTAAAAFKLRGTPAVQPTGAYVYDNVFAHGSLGDAVQTTTGASIHKLGNLTGINGMRELVSCDFDADGVLDTFLATGQTWWYSSGGTHAWTYLNTSTRRTAQLAFGQFDASPGCDVLADGVVYSSGRPPSTSPVIISGSLGLAP